VILLTAGAAARVIREKHRETKRAHMKGRGRQPEREEGGGWGLEDERGREKIIRK